MFFVCLFLVLKVFSVISDSGSLGGLEPPTIDLTAERASASGTSFGGFAPGRASFDLQRCPKPFSLLSCVQ